MGTIDNYLTRVANSSCRIHCEKARGLKRNATLHAKTEG